MERLIRRVLLGWLLLLGAVLLAQQTGYSRLAYWLLWPVAVGCPLVAIMLLWLAVLRLRELWQRVRVLRRAIRRRRSFPRPSDYSWMDQEFN